MQTKISSIQSLLTEDIEDSMSNPSLMITPLPLKKKIKEILKPSATVESPQLNKKMILSDNAMILENNSLMPTSLKMSDQGLISKEKVLTPYWNESCKEKSLQLWLPTKIDLLDSDMTLSNFWLDDPVAKSWFSTILLKVQNPNLPKISSTFCTSSRAECTDSDVILKRSRKIRIYPNKEQQECFKFWFSGNRAAYNIANEYLKQKGTKANWKSIKTGLLNLLFERCPHLKDVPYQIKSLAIKECCTAVKNSKQKFKETKQFQEVSYKKFRNPKQSCYIPKSAIKNNSIYVDVVSTYIAKTTSTKKEKSTGNLIITEKLPKKFGDSTLILENGRWFLSVSYEEIFSPQSKQSLDAGVEIQDKKIVSLDPGIRSFMTFYSEDSCGKLGDSAFTEIQKLGFKLDRLISIKKNTSNKLRFKKRNFHRAINRVRNRIKDLVKEMHHKVALFLVKNFDIILLPKFETQEMVTKNSRKLNSKSARNMMTLSFYKFSLILKDKAKKYKKEVLDVTEEYTSKTVSWNGEIKEKLGSARWIKSGEIVMDRDYNGARGIMLKWLVSEPTILESSSCLGRSPYSSSFDKELEYKSATSALANINNI